MFLYYFIILAVVYTEQVLLTFVCLFITFVSISALQWTGRVSLLGSPWEPHSFCKNLFYKNMKLKNVQNFRTCEKIPETKER